MAEVSSKCAFIHLTADTYFTPIFCSPRGGSYLGQNRLLYTDIISNCDPGLCRGIRKFRDSVLDRYSVGMVRMDENCTRDR